ncbi:MAG: tetratricopeptide repeat protein [Pirellulales bacterium]|nr:tetratricopeptide repeat protein [Pirellulales bacterium]MBL7192369.1 tetratricopeptide repeat protein [Pirellulales bacterium]
MAAERRYPEALEALEHAAGVQASQQPALLQKKAEVLLAMRRPREAAEAFDAVLADDTRSPDDSNPRGYLEYEPAKRLVSDASWVGGARRRAVKIVAPLVRHLPRGGWQRWLQGYVPRGSRAGSPMWTASSTMPGLGRRAELLGRPAAAREASCGRWPHHEADLPRACDRDFAPRARDGDRREVDDLSGDGGRRACGLLPLGRAAGTCRGCDPKPAAGGGRWASRNALADFGINGRGVDNVLVLCDPYQQTTIRVIDKRHVPGRWQFMDRESAKSTTQRAKCKICHSAAEYEIERKHKYNQQDSDHEYRERQLLPKCHW